MRHAAFRTRQNVGQWCCSATRYASRPASTFVALVLLAAFLAGEMWVMSEFPKLNPIAVHIVAVALFIATVRRIAKRRTKSGRNHLIDPVTGKPRT